LFSTQQIGQLGSSLTPARKFTAAMLGWFKIEKIGSLINTRSIVRHYPLANQDTQWTFSKINRLATRKRRNI